MTGKRVLFVSANETAAWGASETTWTTAATRLAAAGVDVWASVKWWAEESRHIAALERLCIIQRRPPDPIERPPYELPFSERQTGILDLAKPALVVVSQGDNWEGLGWMEECRRRGIRYVVISNSASEHFWWDDSLSERLAGAYAGADRAFFVSQANVALTELQLGQVLPNAAITGFPYKVPFRCEVPWPDHDEPLALACVARLDPSSKGQDMLLRALGRPRWRRRPLRLSLFGEGYHERVLRRLAAMLDIRSVSFQGYVDDVMAIWRTHHGLVLPSREEGFPAVIVEAALCGRPSVVTDVAGNTVLVRDGQTGYVIDAPSVAAVDAALERLWSNRSGLCAMGRSAQLLARREVDEDPTADLVADLRALLDDQPSGRLRARTDRLA